MAKPNARLPMRDEVVVRIGALMTSKTRVDCTMLIDVSSIGARFVDRGLKRVRVDQVLLM